MKIAGSVAFGNGILGNVAMIAMPNTRDTGDIRPGGKWLSRTMFTSRSAQDLLTFRNDQAPARAA